MYNVGKITYPFPHFDGTMDKWSHPTLSLGCAYVSMLGLKLINVIKRGLRTMYCTMKRDIIKIKSNHIISLGSLQNTYDSIYIGTPMTSYAIYKRSWNLYGQ